MIGGPIVLYFATNLLLKEAAIADIKEHASSEVVGRAFVALIGILQLWLVGADFLFGTGLPPGAGLNAALLLVVLVLLVSRKPAVHAVGVIILWPLYLTLLTLLSLDIIH